MARIGGDLSATVKVGGEDVNLHFRYPSNEELNNFFTERYEVRGKRMKDNSLNARARFFDLILSNVENLEDKEGKPITPKRAELIPANWKNSIIFKLFEDEEIEVKN